ncbi:TOMM precursor leader peptide-binding protein [Alicyclobacillus herbarius]|uniref:TOMM precursor leader peptide-binding protein n=1 Tax=Alicyclobacillus herbarius TaxID=122960 RepID=UPI0003F91D84|nr:TOMM precursor leader peptide-binding protein [Alicyclobacillus herbarius]
MDTVLVIGEGKLAQLTARELADLNVVRQTDLAHLLPANVGLVLVLHDGWHPAVHQRAEAACRAARIPWLGAFVWLGMGIVGPLVQPGVQGCSECADYRQWMAGADRPEMWQLRTVLAERGGLPRDVWATNTGLSHIAQLVASEARRRLAGIACQTDGRVYRVHLKTLATSLHVVLPNPLCPVCGQMPDDTPDAAKIKLQPRKKSRPDVYRTVSLEALGPCLQRDYLDYRSGLLNGKMHDLATPLATASVNLPLPAGDEATAGRSFSFAESELTAILEALERYCGIEPRAKRTVVHDSYRNLADQALDPARVGLHHPAAYRQPDFPFQPYHPDMTMDWVWGYSFQRQQPVLVPRTIAYYSVTSEGGFVYETSNGCAVGGSLEEAILHGILEVLERDSFLLTWYARLPLPRLNLSSATDPELDLMLLTLRHQLGYHLYLYNATMEHGIPSIFAVAKNRSKQGPHLICAGGSHLEPVRAIKSAIHEVVGTIANLRAQPMDRAAALRMYRDSALVRQMEDHSLLYSLPESEQRLRFLLSSQEQCTLEDAFPLWPQHADLTDDLRIVLDTLNCQGLDVVVVDQTAPELKRNGLYCVKVIIPGMLPMTFGYHLTRLHGLNRVLTVPAQLGYTSEPLTWEQLNPYPHPFP